ncbi:MAG: carbon storage regulator [Acidobacteriota bacterium]
MLVLSRKETEKIRLGDSIVITVIRLAGDKVRLGIEAPRDLVVLRDELETFDPAVSKAGQTQPQAAAAALEGRMLSKSA